MNNTIRSSDRVVVIVLNYNKKDALLECLASLAGSDFQPLEVVVVDNASSDGSAEAVAERYPEFHLVRSPVNSGAAGGRNLGYRYAREKLSFDFAFFIDNDTILEPECAGELVRALAEDSVAGIACPKAFRSVSSDIIMSAGIKVRLSTATLYDIGSGEHDRGQFDQKRYVDACGGFATLVRKDLFEELGGLDENFNPYGWEDVDLCLRAAKAGMRTLFVPAARLCHTGGKSGRGVVLKYERQKARNFMILMRKHAGPLEWLGGMFFASLKATMLIVLAVFKGHGRLAAVLAGGILEGASVTPDSDQGPNDKEWSGE